MRPPRRGGGWGRALLPGPAPPGGRAPFCPQTLITSPGQEASVSRSWQILPPPSTAHTFRVPSGRSRPQGAPRPEAQGLSSSHTVGGLATGRGAPILGGFLQAPLGPQGLWWPLLSNLGPKRGQVPEGKDWKERLRGQGPSWEGTLRGTVSAWELPGSNHPQPPPQGPVPMGDGARRSRRPCPQREPQATGKLPGKVCQAPSVPRCAPDLLGPRRPADWLASLFPS